MKRAGFFLGLVVLAGCSDNSTPWQAWATTTQGEQTWVNPEYESRDDCIAGTKVILDQARNLKTPTDCVYKGDSLVKGVTLNTFYGVNGVHCIARNYRPRGEKYWALLDKDKGKSSPDWTCSYSF